MCVAVPVALAIASAVASAASAVQQHQGQKAQADYTNKSNDIARGEFAREAGASMVDAERQRQQEYEQAASETNAYQAEAARARARMDAMLGENGGGNTSDRQLATLGVRQGQDFATLGQNAQRRQGEIGLGESAAIHSIQSKSASLRPGEQPSKLGLGLSLASTALSFSGRMNDIKNPKPGAGTR